jgi:hypothetical protein
VDQNFGSMDGIVNPQFRNGKPRISFSQVRIQKIGKGYILLMWENINSKKQQQQL